ncbi:phosphotransferase enzyme family protein [Caproiciproducens galactitolivorans]|uniref:Aminoglycoside phosphotransferase family protein n=1 Tax=Caproiciproducens galactitolivorans TaxID=642589 RepID=A0ABT4BSE7_9FIRM|nr:aminoglycoside phosphotransferase family protein [Caproiciproducens galactitolivorans]MCY1713825.1 aminoglycoside phosphotransferase family protein [Caproiciproducens galactitolivorans]
MKPVNQELLPSIVKKFQFEGQFVGLLPYGSGHINDTYSVVFQMEERVNRYILQRINTNVFCDPVELMENVVSVTRYLYNAIEKAGGDPKRETLNLIPTEDGSYYFEDGDGGFWRAYLFIENTVTLQQTRNKEDFYESARSFGRFQLLLAGYPAETLHETIPLFHNTPNRIFQFKEALKADGKGRAAGVQKEIDFVMEREEFTHTLVDLQAQGKLPLRVTHNDTKLNNVLIDADTGLGICVIDLDTVMPGLSLNDFGDSIRFGASTAAEDEPDLSKVHFDLDLFEAYTKGYLEVAGTVLTDAEIDNLPVGAKMLTLECGIRFLTDYLAGDVYFKTDRPDQNLDRARTQFKLVKDMEEKWDAMFEIVKKHWNK